jgi:hypothetical protein
MSVYSVNPTAIHSPALTFGLKQQARKGTSSQSVQNQNNRAQTGLSSHGFLVTLRNILKILAIPSAILLAGCAQPDDSSKSDCEQSKPHGISIMQ